MEEKEQTNKHRLGSAPSARKGVCDILHSLCICRLLRACILRETSTTATRNANSSLTFFPHCLLLLTVLPLNCYLTPTGLFCSPLSTVSLCLRLSTDPRSSFGPYFLCPLPVLQEVSPLGPLCGFCAKAKRFSDRRAHIHTPERPHSVTQDKISQLIVNDIFPKLGTEAEWVTDRGGEFLHEVMRETIRSLNIKNINLFPHHP